MIDQTGNPQDVLIDPAMIRTSIAQARQTACQIDDLRAANSRTIKTLEAALNQAVKGVLNGPLTTVEINAAHRRAHRSGVLPRIASDPELEAFIRTRIDYQTFAEIIKDVDAAFPPNRRTSMSALSRWWKANRP